MRLLILLIFFPWLGGNHLDCFVWKGGFFKKGSFVVLGESGRTGTVKGICRFGCNFILRGFEGMASPGMRFPFITWSYLHFPHWWLSLWLIVMLHFSSPPSWGLCWISWRRMILLISLVWAEIFLFHHLKLRSPAMRNILKMMETNGLSCYLPDHLPFELLTSHFSLWTTYVILLMLLCKMKLPLGLIWIGAGAHKFEKTPPMFHLTLFG